QSIPCPGHFIRAGVSADLAVQIERILDDPALSKRFACTAHRRVVDVFTEEGMIAGHARIYERLPPVRPALCLRNPRSCLTYASPLYLPSSIAATARKELSPRRWSSW